MKRGMTKLFRGVLGIIIVLAIIIIPAQSALAATSAPPIVAINASVMGGHGTVTPNTQTVSSGTNATINITPNTGYHITGITDNGVSMAITNPYVIINVTVTHTVVVTFSNIYPVLAVASVAADPIAFDRATLNGNLTSLGTATKVNVSFEYGVTKAYGKTTKVQPLTAIGSFNAPITGLFPGMVVHFRAKADGGNQGIVYGADMTFTTVSDETTPYGLAKFAFISARDGNEEVYAATPDDVYVARLTNNTFREAWPKFAPDFSKITFTSYRDGNAEVYVMNPDDTVQTRLTNNTAFDGMSDFSSNGSKIAFVSDRDGNYQIYVMNADGSGQTRLTNNAAADIMPAFSPDGTKIAFVSNRDANYEIYVMNADGSGQTRLTNNATTDNYPSWINNSKLTYSTTLYGNSQIYVMNSDGTNLVRLTNNTAVDDQPTWCPIASAIFFTSWRNGNTPQVFIMTPDGVTQTQFTTDPQGNWSRANWTLPASTLKINASVLGGHGTVTPNTQTVTSGTNATINITPNAGYHITGITDNGVSMAITNSYVISNIIAPHTVVVTFGNTYTITATTGAGGTISPSGAVTVNPGASQTFTIKPDTGNSIATLTVDGSAITPVVNSYNFTDVNTNHSISASFTAPPAPAIWWNTAWSRRVEVTITENSGIDLTDYQAKIPVAHNANMQANFGDVRFVNGDNINEISYWMDNVTSNSAEFWVKVPFIPASGKVTIYMYYGNTAVTTTSNIHNTFIWGDDFQDATWTNNNMHQANYGGATQSIQNGILRHQGPVAGEPIAEIFDNGVLKKFPDNYVAEVAVNPTIKAGNAIICPRYATVSNKYESFMDIFWSNAALNKVVSNIWSQLSPPVKVNDPIKAGTWYKLTTVVSKQGNTNRLMVMIDDTNYIDQTDSSLMNPGLALITYDLNNAFDVSYDNFRVREYASTEPTLVTGQEQEQELPAVTTGAASNITSTGATVGGSLTVKGAAASVIVSFEYGTTTEYGSNAVSVSPAIVPGSITANLTGLTPNTLYHFRAKAVGNGTVYGSDATFTTISTKGTTNHLTWIVIGSVLFIAIIIGVIFLVRGRKR